MFSENAISVQLQNSIESKSTAMSMNIDPTGLSTSDQITPVTRTAPAAAPEAAAATDATQEAAVSVEVSGASAPSAVTSADGVPATPPASVLAAVQNATDASAKLEAEGKHVSFDTDPETGALQAALTHADGSSETITGSDALNLASGGEL